MKEISPAVLNIPDDHGQRDFVAKVTDGGYLYMLQGYRDICLSPKEAEILGRWIGETFTHSETSGQREVGK